MRGRAAAPAAAVALGRVRCAALCALLALGLAACAGAAGPAPAPAPAPSEGGEAPPPLPLAPGAGRPDVLVLVTVAGMTPDRYLEPDPAMPFAAALGRAGVAAAAVRPVAPASPYPAHATLVTGATPRRHGVVADRLRGERGVRATRHAHASHLRAPTLWSVLGEADAAVGALDWPTTLGAEIPLRLPDVRPVRSGERWAELVAEAATPWLAELAVAAGPAAARPGPERDRLLVQAACTMLRAPEPPRLVLLRLSQTEPVLRAAGAWSPAARDAFAAADAELAALGGCLAEAGLAERAALAVAGDRALLPVHDAIRPNRVLREAGLLASAGPGGGVAWRALARSNGGSAFVYARDAEAAVAAREALSAAAEATGGFRIVGAEEMIARAADPEAWFGLEATPGYVLLDGLSGPVHGPAPVRASGGQLRAEDQTVGLVLAGRGVREGLLAPAVPQTHVAPTLARLLGIELSAAEGRAFVGWLAPGEAAEPPAP